MWPCFAEVSVTVTWQLRPGCYSASSNLRPDSRQDIEEVTGLGNQLSKASLLVATYRADETWRIYPV